MNPLMLVEIGVGCFNTQLTSQTITAPTTIESRTAPIIKIAIADPSGQF
jgi:hypothetical protein